MGLDTTHDAWHGAYSAFNRWRDALAKAAGYGFGEVDYGGLTGVRRTVLIDWDHVPEMAYYGEWDFMPCGISGPDQLLLLIAHSDCEGLLTTEHCGLLADRLEALLPDLGEQDLGGHVGDLADKTRQFITGCRTAAEAGESLEFH